MFKRRGAVSMPPTGCDNPCTPHTEPHHTPRGSSAVAVLACVLAITGTLCAPIVVTQASRRSLARRISHGGHTTHSESWPYGRLNGFASRLGFRGQLLLSPVSSIRLESHPDACSVLSAVDSPHCLRELTLVNCSINDPALLGSFAGLRGLSLVGCDVDMAALAAFPPAVEDVRISRCPFKDADLIRLLGGRTLDLLDVSATQVTDASAMTIAATGASYVVLDYTQMSEQGVTVSCNRPDISCISINGLAVCDAKIDLSQAKALTSFYAMCSTVGNNTVRQIVASSSVVRADVAYSAVSHEGVLELCRSVTGIVKCDSTQIPAGYAWDRECVSEIVVISASSDAAVESLRSRLTKRRGQGGKVEIEVTKRRCKK